MPSSKKKASPLDKSLGLYENRKIKLLWIPKFIGIVYIYFPFVYSQQPQEVSQIGVELNLIKKADEVQ